MREELLIAVPIFNEAEYVLEMIGKLRKTGFSFVLIDNESDDGSHEIALTNGAEILQRGNHGTGYGAAIQKALDLANARNIPLLGILDCDSTYDPKEFELLIEHIGSLDLVVGARAMNDISPFRRAGNLIHSTLASLLFGQVVKDINSGMRVFRVSKFYGKVKSNDMGFVAETTCLALRNGWRHSEVPISYVGNRSGSKLRPISDGWVILSTIFRVWFGGTGTHS